MHQAALRRHRRAASLARHAADACELKLVATHERPRVERFIFDAYFAAYGARITTFMPQLAAIGAGEDILAACGLRAAGDEPLFVESYLDDPAECAIARAAGVTVSRPGLCEVGNLAISRAGSARLLIARLTRHLHACGFEWAVFTAVPALRNNFIALGIPLYTLAHADAERLPAGARAEWGRYYLSAPQVSAVRVKDAAGAVGVE